MCRDLDRSVPTICVLFRTLFQERVSNFAINILQQQHVTFTEQNMRLGILESSGLAKPEDLIMNKTVLNSA